MEWHAVPQNSLVPVRCTITCVPTMATPATRNPSTRMDSTDQRALGWVSAYQDRETMLRRGPSGKLVGMPRPRCGCTAALLRATIQAAHPLVCYHPMLRAPHREKLTILVKPQAADHPRCRSTVSRNDARV